MTSQVTDMFTELHQYEKILTKLDKNFRIRVMKFLDLDKDDNWLYWAIYNNTHYDFCGHLSKLSGLLRKDEKFKYEIDSILNNSSYPLKLRFFAYYIIYTYYRTHKDYSIARNFMETYLSVFQSEPMFQVTRNILLEMSNDPIEVEQGIRISHELAFSGPFKGNVGIYHSYAESVITGIEREIGFIHQNKEEYIHLALDLIQRALDKQKYAKYYFTHGRLLFYLAQSSFSLELYKKARQVIQKAIDIEDSNREDYYLRILEYQSYLTRIDMHLDYLKLNASLEETSEEMSQKIETQFLSFLEKEKKLIFQKIVQDHDLSVIEFIKKLIESQIEHYRRFKP